MVNGAIALVAMICVILYGMFGLSEGAEMMLGFIGLMMIFLFCCLVALCIPAPEPESDTRSHTEKAEEALERARRAPTYPDANYWHNEAIAQFAAARAEREE